MTRFSRGVQRVGLICATAALVLLPSVGYGLGLGPLKVTSALNEPLDATIEFTSITNKELQTLEVGLAPVSAFQAVGIPFSQELTGLQFLVEHHPNGRPFLRVTTQGPFPEPYLHILVQAEWAGGRLRREYTALIDPPFLNASKPGSIQAPQASAPSMAENVPTTPPASEAAGAVAPQVSETGSGAGAPKIKVEPVPQSEISGSSTSAASVPTVKSEPLPSPTQTASAPPPPVTTTRTAPLESTASASTSSPASEAAGEKPEPIGMLPGEFFGPQPAAAPVSAPDWATRKSYRVKRGDTAWEIAQRIRRDRKLSLEQVVLALYDSNPNAFYGKNVNNLKAGKILRIPDANAVEKITRTRAHHVFFAQYDEWQEYKVKLARSQHPVKIAAADNKPSPSSASSKPAEAAQPIAKHKAPEKAHAKAAKKGSSPATAKAPPAKAHAPKKAPAKSITAKVDKPAGIQLPPTRGARKQELLRIVRANLDKGKQAGKQAESETKAKQQQKLDESVARLNTTAAGKKPKGAENASEAGTPLPKTKTKERPIEIANPHLAKVEPGVQKKVEPAKPVLKPEARHKPLRVERRPRLPHRVAPPQPEPGMLATVQGMLNQILGNQFMLLLIGGVVVLAGLVLMVYARRRRQSLTEFEESILTSGDVASSDFSTDSDQVSAGSASDTSFLSDFSQGGLGNISTDEVDPVAEADVYLAYGRDEQAEEILKDAVVKNPDRNELKEKLLEIYAGRSDVAGFETLAEELYASLQGAGGPLWDRVVDMGRKLAPENPMFSGGAAPAAPAAMAEPAAAADETLAIGGDTGGAMDFGMGEAAPAADNESTGLEFDLGTAPSPEDVAPDAADTSLEMDMDLGQGIEPAPAVEAGEGEEGLESVSDSNELDFNFDLSGTGEEPAAAEEAEFEAPAIAEPGEDEAGGLEFTGLEGFGEELEGEGAEAAEAAEEEELALPDLEESSEEGLSDSESLDFEALRKNTPDNNRTGLSLSIDTEMGGLDEDSADVAVENEVSFDGDDLSFEAPAAPEPAPSTGGISAEVEDPSVTVGGGQDQWDEAATKLDLAKAYIDMGDADGARSILEEVAVEGNEDQQRQAAELAAQIS